MSTLEQTLNDLCSQHNWQPIHILANNSTKQLLTARVRLPNGQNGIAKLTVIDAAEATLGLLRTERRFYEQTAFSLTPKLLAHGDHYLCREYIEGGSLREWLLDPAHGDPSALLTSVIESLAASRFHPTEERTVGLAADAAFGRFRNLLTSGPAGTRRSSIEERAARWLARLSKRVLRPWLLRSLTQWNQRGVAYASRFGHNDLHCNNVLITNRGPVIIDYERASEPGVWIVDALYLLATATAQLRAPSQRQLVTQRLCQLLTQLEPNMQPELPRLVGYFTAAGFMNTRFRGSPWRLTSAVDFRRTR
jgi:predicted Ser/Thr protein kinase